MADRSTNEKTLRDLIDVFWNQQAFDQFDRFFHEDAVLHSGVTDYPGSEGLCDRFAVPFVESFPDLNHEIVFLVVDGDMAAMRYHGTGTLKGDYGSLKAAGQKLDYHGTVIFQMRDGRIAEVWGHSDLADWAATQEGAT